MPGVEEAWWTALGELAALDPRPRGRDREAPFLECGRDLFEVVGTPCGLERSVGALVRLERTLVVAAGGGIEVARLDVEVERTDVVAELEQVVRGFCPDGGELGRLAPAGAKREESDAGRDQRDDDEELAQARAPATSATRRATSVGFVPTRTPCASSASFFAWAVPALPEMIAPAWPIVLPGGAVKPAM
jgi:hypothetical protein